MLDFAGGGTVHLIGNQIHNVMAHTSVSLITIRWNGWPCGLSLC